MTLTERQLEHLRYLRWFRDEHGWWPSVREFASRFADLGHPGSKGSGKGSVNAAVNALRILQAKEYIYVEPRTARAMRFTAKAWKVFNDEA